MKQENLFDPIPRHRLESLSKEELIEFYEVQQRVIESFQKHVDRLESLNAELNQKTFLIEDQYIVLKNKFFGKSSERSPRSESENDGEKPSKPAKSRVQLPSLRYPNAPLIEREVELKELPNCSCCGHVMSDSGMTEDSEFLTVIPAEYIVVRQKRHKYRCSQCHGDVKTAPAPPRIKSGSAYSDEMMVDVACSKYCDLIPIERYAAMAGREGLEDLPPQSLIETTHYVADFAKPAYLKLKEEIVSSKLLHADETRHRMLEGSDKSGWYLWGFSTPETSFFEIHDTRSGDVASEILAKSKCEFLVSDVFSGYGKAVKESNKVRKELNLVPIKNVYCNAHARRKFRESKEKFPEESQFFADKYKLIYQLESEAKGKPPDEVMKLREQMTPLFEDMKTRAMADKAGYSSKSSLGKAMSYFLKNYEGLTLFLKNSILPIDNNPQERLLRSPVVGRKTWYGTHSERGAETTAILFSLVESCKLNGVNPREYLKNLVQDLHLGKPAYTPREFKDLPR